MWSSELWSQFEDRFGYSLSPYLRLDKYPQVRDDYRKFIAEVICREFYREFTAICHDLGTYSRVQCHGAPTDLLSAYAAVDVPESESLLFPPRFSRIPASAAALASKPVVSAETFTCIYGFASRTFQLPRWLLKKEQPADLKLLVDGLIANGVNQVVWHGIRPGRQTHCRGVKRWRHCHLGFYKRPKPAQCPGVSQIWFNLRCV